MTPFAPGLLLGELEQARRGERADRRPRVEVEQRDGERRGVDPLVTLRGEVVQHAGQQDPARAEPDRAELVADR